VLKNPDYVILEVVVLGQWVQLILELRKLLRHVSDWGKSELSCDHLEFA